MAHAVQYLSSIQPKISIAAVPLSPLRAEKKIYDDKIDRATQNWKGLSRVEKSRRLSGTRSLNFPETAAGRSSPCVWTHRSQCQGGTRNRGGVCTLVCRITRGILPTMQLESIRGPRWPQWVSGDPYAPRCPESKSGKRAITVSAGRVAKNLLGRSLEQPFERVIHPAGITWAR